MAEREELTWVLFGIASRELAVQVADSGFRPDLIRSIARGGLFVAGATVLVTDDVADTGATLRLFSREGQVLDA